MIVDDNARMRSVIREFLTDMNVGRSYVECGDGKEAVDTFGKYRPDCVLMDIRMKGLDGIVTTQMLRERHPGARVIIVTDYDAPELREAAKAAGAQGYVLKENLFDLVALLKEGET